MKIEYKNMYVQLLCINVFFLSIIKPKSASLDHQTRHDYTHKTDHLNMYWD
jgi:hypothetical protein